MNSATPSGHERVGDVSTTWTIYSEYRPKNEKKARPPSVDGRRAFTIYTHHPHLKRESGQLA